MPERSYKTILLDAEAFFSRIAAEQPSNLQCAKGCSLCCYGLFEIGAGDVAVISEGLASLHPARRARIIRKARAILAEAGESGIGEMSEAEKEAFFDRTESVACPNLDDSGACMIYEHRPMVCRTFGLPLREGDRYIGDICELNFTSASQDEKESAAWDILREDVYGPGEEFTIPEAIVLAARARGWLKDDW